MRSKNIQVVLILSLFINPLLWANESFSRDERNIVAFLAEATAIGKVEQICNDWDEDTSSNIQTLFTRGIYAVLSERLGKDRTISYLQASRSVQTPIANYAIRDLENWRKAEQLKAINTYCTEDLLYSRTFIANLLLGSVSDLLNKTNK